MTAPEFRFTRGDEAEIAETLIDVLKSAGWEHLVSDRGEMYGYRESTGLYETIPKDLLGRMVAAFAGNPVGPRERPLHIRAGTIAGAVKIAHSLRADPGFFDSAPAGIAFADSFVRVTDEGIAAEPHSPSHRARCAFPFAFPADSSEAPLFDAFHAACFRGDEDAVEKARTLEEADGAALCGLASKFERALIRLGPGGSGKSHRRQISEALMPKGSLSHLEPRLWSDQYARPALAGSLLNSLGELPSGAILEGGYVKSIISGEAAQARIPGRPPFSFVPRCAHHFCVNPSELPKVRDRSDGFRRRWVIVTFNRSFIGDPDRDVDMAAKVIAAELPQIARRALEGAVRLLKRGDYELPPSHHAALDGWLPEGSKGAVASASTAANASAVEGFLKSLGPGETRGRDLYAMYAEARRARGEEPMSEKAFGTLAKGFVGSRQDKHGVIYLVGRLN